MVSRDVNKQSMITVDEVSENEKKEAREKGWTDPEFDYRDQFNKGDRIFYTRIIPELGIKELLTLTVQTVYARTLIAFEPKSVCHVIGFNKRNRVFTNRADALEVFESVDVKEVS